MTSLIAKERIKRLNSCDVKNRQYVLYWMQSSHRIAYNFALEYAVSKANKLDKPLIAFFGFTPKFPEANLRHYNFMLEGLREASHLLEDIGAKMVILNKAPEKGVIELAKKACLTVVDKGYLKKIKQWNSSAVKNMECPLIQVEDNVVVPLSEASSKEEYSARTIRPKIAKKINSFLTHIEKNQPKKDSSKIKKDSLDLTNIEKILADPRIDKSVDKTKQFIGGTSEANKHLENFIQNKLSDYPEKRNDPNIDCLSNLSPYLHFGQISPIYATLRILEANVSKEAKEAYLEELIIRRELAINYVAYNDKYDCFEGLPDWAKRTLQSHKKDSREYLYNLEELENAKTHDCYWNAAQSQMQITGKMHSYMRMYWGKKLIEWSKNPEIAFKTALYLNNKYELDGRDPNGFSGVAWCFGKHDRPWKERAIFGKVRYMNENGLRRKFNVDKYVKKVKDLGRN